MVLVEKDGERCFRTAARQRAEHRHGRIVHAVAVQISKRDILLHRFYRLPFRNVGSVRREIRSGQKLLGIRIYTRALGHWEAYRGLHLGGKLYVVLHSKNGLFLGIWSKDGAMLEAHQERGREIQ